MRNHDLEFAIEIVKHAGGLILGYFRGDYDVRQKSGNNPVASADLAADTHLREEIERKFPQEGWLSEETADFPERLGRKRAWVVDSWDGTKELAHGLSELAVSPAVVGDGTP